MQDKLTAYTELLKEQAAQLQAELRELRLHPKYAPLLVDDAFGGPMVVDGPAEVERLDAQIAQLGAAIERLSTDQALAKCAGLFARTRLPGNDGRCPVCVVSTAELRQPGEAQPRYSSARS